MNKKFLLSFASLFGIFTGAMADDYGLKICGIDVTDENKGDLIAVVNSQKSESDPVATGTMTYNSETKTLSMNNVAIDISRSQIICPTKTLTIEQTGTNIIKASELIVYIYPTAEDITIKGDGTLTCTVTDGYSWSSYPIQANVSYGNCKITIDHTTLICNSECEYLEPIYGCYAAELVINESTVKSAGGFDYWKSITLTNVSISEPNGAYLYTAGWNEIQDAEGKVAKNVVIVPDTRKESQLAWSKSNWGCYYGDDYGPFPTLINPENVAVAYESDHPEFATVDASTGVVTILKPSVVDYPTSLSDGRGNNLEEIHIKAIFAGNTEYKPQIANYVFSIYKGEPQFAVSGSTKAFLGETFESPVVTVKNGAGETLDFAVTYSSSDENVATVDANTGDVTVKGVGETTISLATVENDNYYAGEGSYTLQVIERGVTTLSFEKESYSVPAGGTFTAPTLNNPDNVTVTYSSSNTAVAIVDAYTGEITIVGVGETTITAESEKTDEFEAASASYLLKVNKITPSVVFAKAEFEATIGESFESPLATTTPVGLAVTYSSSNETVATVDAATGVVTLLKAGTTEITATVAEDDIYNAASGKYTLTVSASTGIGQVNATTESAEVFDLLGRRVQGVTNRGLYIVNGHKVICK